MIELWNVIYLSFDSLLFPHRSNISGILIMMMSKQHAQYNDQTNNNHFIKLIFIQCIYKQLLGLWTVAISGKLGTNAGKTRDRLVCWHACLTVGQPA